MARKSLAPMVAIAALASTSMVASPTLVAAQSHTQPHVAPDPLVARTSFYLPMRDGVRLAVNVYRPAKDGKPIAEKAPAVFAFTPYRARYRDDSGKIIDLIDSNEFGLRNLVHHGYVVATADIRGKGASFGSRRGFLDQTEANDGAQIIEWLAQQPYSDGRVGMTGCSYLGGTAMLVASARPPALKAVFSAATDWDKYTFVRRGGITAQFNTRPDEPATVDLASVPVDADTDGKLLRAAVAQHSDNTPMAGLWYGMPYRDSVSQYTNNAFWEEVGPYPRKAEMNKPGLAWYLWGNWSDEPTEQVLRSAANIDNAKLIVGPGLHCVNPDQFDITAVQKRFFDHYLKGVDNGIDNEPKYSWWREDGTGGTLVRSNRLPGADATTVSLYLDMPGQNGSEGTLDSMAPSAQRYRFAIDYDLDTESYFSFWPKAPGGHGPAFSTPPLAEAATIEGYPVISVQASADAQQANMFAYLEDVDPSGKSTVLALGRLAGSHRKLSPPPYDNLGLPYHSGLKADVSPLPVDQPVTLRFALSPRSYVVGKGHRLRVVLAGADPRQRNLAQIKSGLAKSWTLVGGTDGSRIDIPFVTPVRFEKPAQSQ